MHYLPFGARLNKGILMVTQLNGTFSGVRQAHRLNLDLLRECMGFHRLNPNSFHDRICIFSRFHMDTDHYDLSFSASLLFPEP